MKNRMISACVPAVLLTVLLALVCPVSLHGQGIRQSVGIVKEKKDHAAKGNEPVRKPPVSAEPFQRNDTLYCTLVRKIHGWSAPLDTIGKEELAHINAAGRFTHRYPSGHWGKMEIVDREGNLTASGLSSYVLNVNSSDSDPDANAEWVKLMKTVCSYEFIADPSGKILIQERAYDKEGNIVYTYSRVPTGNGQCTGSYKDRYGLPAEMRKDSLFTRGTLVRITEDRWGNDSVVQYIDAKGKPKPNISGAAMQVYVRDKYGHTLRQESRDKDGKLTVDDWGNCGTEYTWLPDHRVLSSIIMDDDWQPMRLPNNSRTANDNDVGTIKTRFSYDRYGNKTEEAYYTADDVPDSNAFGIHRITFEYDDRGNTTKVVNHDTGNNLKNDVHGVAVYEYTYDEAGRNIRSAFLDEDRQPCSKEECISRSVSVYNDAGEKILLEEYSVHNGQEVLSYRYEKGKYYERVMLEDGTSCVDSLDEKGNPVRQAFYDTAGSLFKEPSVGYAMIEMKCTDRPNGYRSTTLLYDENKKLFYNPEYGFAVKVEENDTVSRLTRYYRYDSDGNLVDVYIHNYDDEKVLAQYDSNGFGEVCRSGGNVSVRLYKADVNYSPNGSSYSTFIGRDEFNEPDYISSPWSVYYYMKLMADGTSQVMDENNRVVTDPAEFRNTCPKVMTIEVTDSAAYRTGIRDNDVILLDGDYAAGIFAPDSLVTSYKDFIAGWTLHSVLEARKNRSMVVFRVNPETLEYGLVKIDNLQGTPSELGYLAHIRYLTQKQLKRIRSCVEENFKSDNPLVRKDDFVSRDYSGSHSVILFFTDMFREVRKYPYPTQVIDPSVLLAACMKDGDMEWKLGGMTEDFDRINDSRQVTLRNYPAMHFYVTRNGKDIIDVKLDERTLSTTRFYTSVSDEVYRQLAELCRQTEPLVAREMADVPELPGKYLTTHWVLGPSDNGSSPEARISFLKDGTVKGYIERYGSIPHGDGHAVFRVRQILDGKWTAWGRIIEAEYPEKDSLSVECVDYTGSDPTLKAQVLEQMNQSVKNDPGGYASRMGITPLGRFVYVKSLSKDSLVMDGGSGEELVFRRLSKDDLKK